LRFATAHILRMSNAHYLAPLMLLVAVGCVQTAESVDESVPDDATSIETDPKDDSASSSLCQTQDQMMATFDRWAAAQPRPSGSIQVQNSLEAIVEAGPNPVFAVQRRVAYGPGSYDQYTFIVSLDQQGHVTHKAPGRYIDRIGANTYLVDKAYAQLHYGSADPLYYRTLQIEAVDRDGTRLWNVANRGNASLSKVFRMDGNHFMIMGITYGVSEPQLAYFDSHGVVTEAPMGDTRECAKPVHYWCTSGC
jgi:hypothetical protein